MDHVNRSEKTEILFDHKFVEQTTENLPENQFANVILNNDNSFLVPIPMDHTLQQVVLPSHYPSKKLENAITICENAEKRSNGNPNLIVKELADLKRQIDLYDEKMKDEKISLITKISAFFSRLFGQSTISYADILYSRNKDLLNETQQTNLLKLESSYNQTSGYAPSLTVTELNLPEGKYTGPIKNGLPHGAGTLKISKWHEIKAWFK